MGTARSGLPAGARERAWHSSSRAYALSDRGSGAASAFPPYFVPSGNAESFFHASMSRKDGDESLLLRLVQTSHVLNLKEQQAWLLYPYSLAWTTTTSQCRYVSWTRKAWF